MCLKPTTKILQNASNKLPNLQNVGVVDSVNYEINEFVQKNSGILFIKHIIFNRL